MELDIEFVRGQFPAFQTEALKGQALFENAGGSYTCKPVIDRLNRFYTERKVQPYHSFEASRLGGEEMDEARARLAGFLGVQTDELSFGPSTTQNSYVLAQAFGQMLSEGDVIIVTNQDHEANSGPWRRLAERGIDICEWKIDPDSGQLELEGLTELLDESVKLVCFPHCSNIVGQLNPVKQIVQTVHDAGAYVCVDGVSAAPHGLPDIGELGADIYLFSAYKTFGPHQGVMTISRSLGQKLPNQGHYFNHTNLYKRFTPAGPDHAQVAACAGMVDYFEAVHNYHFNETANAAQICKQVRDLFVAHEAKLLQPLLDYLDQKNSVQLIGSNKAQNRAATVALRCQEDPATLAHNLASKKIMAGAGDFYAVRLLQALGIDPDRGVLRLSFVHYTSQDEIDQLINALDQLL